MTSKMTGHLTPKEDPRRQTSGPLRVHGQEALEGQQCEIPYFLLLPPAHKIWGRMPVAQVIMMVESGDGKRALLGRSRGHLPGMLTCLAGFVDQCESVGVLHARSVELRYIGKRYQQRRYQHRRRYILFLCFLFLCFNQLLTMTLGVAATLHSASTRTRTLRLPLPTHPVDAGRRPAIQLIYLAAALACCNVYWGGSLMSVPLQQASVFNRPTSTWH